MNSIETYTTFDALVPEKIEDHRSDLDRWIETELAKTKDVALSDFQKMMDEQAANVKNLKRHFDRGKGLHDQILADAAKVHAAVKDGKNSELMAVRQRMLQLLKDLDQNVDQFERAMADNWIKARILASKDKSAIEGAIKQMIAFKGDAHRHFDETANIKPA